MQKTSLSSTLSALKGAFPSDDVLYFTFTLPGGTPVCAVYVDGMVDKTLLGELVVKPLKDYENELTLDELQRALALPECKPLSTIADFLSSLASGNGVLLVDGVDGGIELGIRATPMRAVSEPPTGVAVKGPRTGFVEDIKTNTALIRSRLSNPMLTVKQFKIGKQSQTDVAVFSLSGVADEKLLRGIEEKLQKIDVDILPDSSVVGMLLAERKRSFFKQSGTTEKPDVFCARLAEGRVGVVVNGSPIALTFPYLIVEDLQTSEDYFVSPYRATFLRVLRLFSLLLSVYLPAFYVAAQLYKIELLPLELLLTVAGGMQELPLSPSLEMLYALLILEILTEAGIRMPKYVGLALSVVGALVLGDTAVNAGFLSTPAIMIVALSGICLYTVPELVETTSLLRLLMLLFAGSIGTYGIALLTAFMLYYAFSLESYGVSLMSPFAPLSFSDGKDSLAKFSAIDHPLRPKALKSKNKRRAKYEK